MYKVLIVDDEPNIRAGLKVIIDWNELGYEICGEASNGVEALNKIESLLPNLCIVDINMPQMDGLELVKIISERKWDIKIIILSGYQEFNYAKKAIDYNVIAYLLKPIDEDELISIVTNVRQKFIQQQIINKQQVKYKAISRDKFFEKLIFDDQSDEYIDHMNFTFNTNLPWSEYQLALIEVIFQSEDKIQLQTQVYQATQSEVERMQAGFVFNIGEYIVILINQLSFTRVNGMLNFLHQKLLKEKNIQIVIAVGGNTTQIIKLNDLFYKAQKALKYKFFANDDVILLPLENEIMDKKMSNNTHISIEPYMKSMYIAVETLNTHKINDIVRELSMRMQENFMPENKIKSYMLRIYVGVAGEIIKKEMDIGLNDLFNEKFYNEFYSCSSLNLLEDYITNKLSELSKQISSQNPNDMLSRLVRYIDLNYQKDIKLEELAEIFGYNSAYLGKVFRNLTGDYFNTYVDKVRIAKAKELLSTTNLKVNDIAQKTGYSNYDYFSIKFKKIVGISPSVYRQTIKL
ncbi:MAG: response regulator [Oscillospiraceae bacterium]